MNKLCVNLIKQSLHQNVFRGGQLMSLSRIDSFCNAASSGQGHKAPLSKNPKHKTSPQITLLSGSDKIDVVTLDQAKKIAERRQLKLVNIIDFDTKSNRPVYKLMTGAEFLAAELKHREQKKSARLEPQIKGEKLLTIASKTSMHDLEMKINKTCKWIEKFNEVRVVIIGDASDGKKNDEITEAIETAVKKVEGRVLQKRIKDGTTRFSILPTLKKDKNVEPPHKQQEKKLLEPDKGPMAQQVKTLHTMAF